MVTGSLINITHYQPKPLLEKYIRKISVFNSKSTINYRQKLTPSAFTYLSYNHEDIPVSIFGKKIIQPNSRLQIAGPKVSDNIYVEYSGKLYQILVEFSASGFYYLFHASPSQNLNTLSALKNFITLEITEHLERELIKSENIESSMNIIEEFLFDKLHNALPFIDYIEEALQMIENNHGHININNLVDDLNIGKRQFNRKFQEIVGLSPKSYSKIVQLHYVITLMQSKQYASLQELSYQAEFYDHSHFTNRFKELTGFTPNEFIKSDKHIALKYFTDPFN